MGFFPPGTPAIEVITPSNPAAGADLATVIGNNKRLEIVGVQYTLAADATITTRIPNIRFAMGGTNMTFWDATGLNASGTLILSWFAGLGETKNVSSIQRYNPLPPGILLTEAAPITTLIFNLQAGDQLSNVVIWAKQWIQPD